MLKKAYVEITNCCNLRCSFCPGTRREKRVMRAEEFAAVLDRLAGYVRFVYLHVMGEPLSHPALAEILSAAAQRDMRVCITTNGTLLAAQRETLLAAGALHKVSISLHSFEGNGNAPEAQEAYLAAVWDFAEEAAKRGVLIALRLWNEGGLEEQNAAILAYLLQRAGLDALPPLKNGSAVLAERIFLERAQKFDWPDLSAPPQETEFCRGLRDQIGILADGTVVPCCLDHEGDLALGNIFTQPLDEILQGPRAAAIREGFSRRTPAEELCRRCGYAARFTK